MSPAILNFLRTSTPSEIAAQLARDHANVVDPLSRILPSTLAQFLPTPRDPISSEPSDPSHLSLPDQIAVALVAQSVPSEHSGVDVPLSICRMRYEHIHETIVAFLEDAYRVDERKRAIAKMVAGATEKSSERNDDDVRQQHDSILPALETLATAAIRNHLIPTPDDYAATAKVLNYLLRVPISHGDIPDDLRGWTGAPREFSTDTPLINILSHAEHLSNPSAHITAPTSVTGALAERQRCYLCRFTVPATVASSSSSTAKGRPRMCDACAAFNSASNGISLPGKLDLSGQRVVITGARINLGYHTTLRLLRCGARVLGTSRYPHDAAQRFSLEADYAAWKDRLTLFGADFRSTVEVFQLVEAVRDWVGEQEKLDVLINNAALTLVERIGEERDMVLAEEQLRLAPKPPPIPILNRTLYDAVAGGGTRLPTTDWDMAVEMDKQLKCSWAQTLTDIPYRDVLATYSTNALAPFILTRELLPLLSRPHSSPTRASPKSANGHIINVTAREGLFELNRTHPVKSGRHVHTNMAKAALNMFTHTEAVSAWRQHRVAVNVVEPGWLSAHPEWEAESEGRWKRAVEEGRLSAEDGRFPFPLEWDDGVGRVLWTVGKEARGETVWGRCLRHYTAVGTREGWSG